MSTKNATAVRAPATHNRVPKGISTGGQFAVSAHAEAPVSLGAPSNGRLEDFTDSNDFVRLAYDSASYWQHRYTQKDKSNTIDLDDIAQETMMQVIKKVRNGDDIQNFRQLVNSIAANVTVRATENVFRAEDRRAWRIFAQKRTDLENATGRSLSQREEDALAQQVLDEWEDPRHKPSKDFRTPRTVDISLDRPFSEGDGVESTLGATLVNPEQSHRYIRPGSYMDQAHSALETKGAANKAEAKRLAWNALAELAEAPLSQSGSLSQRQVTKHRGVMTAHANGTGEDRIEGAAAACKDWSDGRDNEATEALFAPFGEIDDDGKEKVVAMFERLGSEKAQTMWESAMAWANNKHQKVS